MSGERLGRYELVRPLGRGGGGEVWEALLHGPAGFRRRVAIKRLAPSHQDPVLLDGLLSEARLGALVSHPNIVSTLELGQHDGRWFLVMDLVRGQTTSALARDGMPPGCLLDIGVQTCRGLSHIHELTDHLGRPLGLVHRDIKPANLLVDDSGMVRIVDLGIARLVGEPNQPAGTPGYMPLEQLDGDEDARADLFALGATLARLATGRRLLPPSRQRLGALARVDERVAQPEVQADLDRVAPGLGAVVARAMRSKPDERYPTAAAMGDALEQLLAKVGDTTRLSRWMSGKEAAPPPETTASVPRIHVGRQRELTTLRRRSQAPGVVVVKGPPGIGKTHLLDQLLRRASVRRSVRCDLVAIGDVAGLCRAVAQILSVPAGAETGRVERLGEALRRAGPLLLVLDHAERVAASLPDVLSRWCHAAPHLSVVVGSRQAVPLRASTELRVGPLPAHAAGALFRQLIGGASHDEVVEAIVRHVDRVPLGIELAAARAKLTSPRQVLDVLRAAGASALDDGDRGVDRSLRASWVLLSDDARDGLARLAAFERSFDLDDASAVLAGHAEPMGLLHHLVDHSLLQVRERRFRLMPSLQGFVRRAGSREALTTGHRLHGRWLARLGDPVETRFGRYTPSHRARVARWLDDLVVAHHRALRADPATAVATAIAASQVFLQIGPLELAESLLRTALRRGVREHEVRRRLVVVLTNLGRFTEAEALAQEGLQRVEDPVVAAHYRVVLGMAMCRRGADGLALMEEAWLVQKMAGDPGYAYTVGELGANYLFELRFDDAEHHLNLAIEASERQGDTDVDYHRGMLATLYAFQLQTERATALFESVIASLVEQGRSRLLTTIRANYAEMLMWAGPATETLRQAERAVTEGTAVGRPGTVAGSLAVQAHIHRLQGRTAQAVTCAQEALTVLGDSEDLTIRHDALVALGLAQHEQGRAAEAQRRLEQALAITQGILGDARAHRTLAMARAAPLRLRQAAEREVGPSTFPRAQLLVALARGWWAVREGRVHDAPAHLAEAQALCQAIDPHPTALLHAEVERLAKALTS